MNELYFSPDIIEVGKDEEFSVDIMLDTKGLDIAGVDIDLPVSCEIIRFEINPLLPVVFDRLETNRILFSQITNPPNLFKGAGKLGTLTLRTKSETRLNFNFTLGATNDTNMALSGVDLLTDVGECIINMKGNSMAINPELLAALQGLANQYAVKIQGTVTPTVVPEPFDITPA